MCECCEPGGEYVRRHLVSDKGTTGHNKFCSKKTHLDWSRGVIEDTIYLMNITDTILLALTFELTQKYSASKSQHC